MGVRILKGSVSLLMLVSYKQQWLNRFWRGNRGWQRCSVTWLASGFDWKRVCLLDYGHWLSSPIGGKDVFDLLSLVASHRVCVNIGGYRPITAYRSFAWLTPLRANGCPVGMSAIGPKPFGGVTRDVLWWERKWRLFSDRINFVPC